MYRQLLIIEEKYSLKRFWDLDKKFAELLKSVMNNINKQENLSFWNKILPVYSNEISEKFLTKILNYTDSEVNLRYYQKALFSFISLYKGFLLHINNSKLFTDLHKQSKPKSRGFAN